MALVDVDSWLTEYEACERLSETILTQLTQREKRQRLSPEYNRLTAAIQIALTQYDTELKQLQQKLDTSDVGNSITFEENERRRYQVDLLRSKFNQLQTKFSNTTRSDLTALLDEPTTSQWRSSASGDNTDVIIDTSNVEALKRRQIDILEDQNRGLESLSQTISRQRLLASQLGREVEDQNDILDNMANTMERVDAGVNAETNNISIVNRQDSTWGYWIVILVLFVAIVIVALL